MEQRGKSSRVMERLDEIGVEGRLGQRIRIKSKNRLWALVVELEYRKSSQRKDRLGWSGKGAGRVSPEVCLTYIIGLMGLT